MEVQLSLQPVREKTLFHHSMMINYSSKKKEPETTCHDIFKQFNNPRTVLTNSTLQVLSVVSSFNDTPGH